MPSRNELTMRTSTLFFAAIALFGSTAFTAPAAADTKRLAQVGRWLVDGQGRVITIHGGNVFVPTIDGRPGDRHAPFPGWTGDSPRRMTEEGFNGVRLAIFLSDLMPAPGKIDRAYLERIASSVRAYEKAGIRTLIDFHQDEYSSTVGARGMPAWAVITDGLRRDTSLSFPMGYFRDPAVQRAFDNFYANRKVQGSDKGVQDLYVEALAAVAERFAASSAVVGIDVMNEPATGSRCATPDPKTADCPQLERELLGPFYAKAAGAISKAAPKMLVFVEPFMLQGALGIPINTPTAGSPGRRGISFHNYGPVQVTRDRVNDAVVDLATKREAAILNTEWGFSNDPAEIARQAEDFDRRLISWLAWPRGAWEAIVDPRLPDEGNGNREALLRAYARPYAEAIAGTPSLLRFDPAAGSMELRYSTRLVSGRYASASATTDIRVPHANYPNGYRLKITGGRAISPADAPVVRVVPVQGSREVRVILERLGDLPPVAATPLIDDTDKNAPQLPPIPPGPLGRTSLLGHIVAAPRGRRILDEELPGMLAGVAHVQGWQTMTLESLRKFAPSMLDDARLSRIDQKLGRLHTADNLRRPSVDWLTSDLLANSAARRVLDREAPQLANAPEQSLYTQTRLRDLPSAMPSVLSPEVMRRITAAFDTIPSPSGSTDEPTLTKGKH